MQNWERKSLVARWGRGSGCGLLKGRHHLDWVNRWGKTIQTRDLNLRIFSRRTLKISVIVCWARHRTARVPRAAADNASMAGMAGWGRGPREWRCHPANFFYLLVVSDYDLRFAPLRLGSAGNATRLSFAGRQGHSRGFRGLVFSLLADGTVKPRGTRADEGSARDRVLGGNREVGFAGNVTRLSAGRGREEGSARDGRSPLWVTGCWGRVVFVGRKPGSPRDAGGCGKRPGRTQSVVRDNGPPASRGQRPETRP